MKFREAWEMMERGEVAKSSERDFYRLVGSKFGWSADGVKWQAAEGLLERQLLGEWELVVEDPAKQCRSVAPSRAWVCSEPHGHAGRHSWKNDNTTASWPNLQELNATIVEQRATIARLEAQSEAARAMAAKEWQAATSPVLPQDWPVEALREVNELRRDRGEWRQKARDANAEAFVNKTLLDRERDRIAVLTSDKDYWEKRATVLREERDRERECCARNIMCGSVHPEQTSLHCVFVTDHGGPYHGNPHAIWPKAATEPDPHRVKVQG